MLEDWPFGRISQGTIRNECVAYLRDVFPQIEVVSLEPESLRLRLESGSGHQVFLDRIFSAIETLEDPSPSARRQVYEAFFKVLNDRVPEELSEDIDGDRLRPRVISRETLEAMHRQIGLELPRMALQQTGLWIVYVLDSEHSVAFVTEAMRERLGMDLGALHERSMLNLAATFDAAEFVKNLEAGSLVRVMTLDSYDASRLLLLPDHVPEGVRLAVAVPDRDLLLVLRAEDESAFDVMSQVAKVPCERPVFDGALEVTRNSIRLY